MVQLMEKPLDLSPPPPLLPHSATCCPPPLPPPFFSPSLCSSFSLSSLRFLPIFVWLEALLFLLTLPWHPGGELNPSQLPKTMSSQPAVGAPSPRAAGAPSAAKSSINRTKLQKKALLESQKVGRCEGGVHGGGGAESPAGAARGAGSKVGSEENFSLEFLELIILLLLPFCAFLC